MVGKGCREREVRRDRQHTRSSSLEVLKEERSTEVYEPVEVGGGERLK